MENKIDLKNKLTLTELDELADGLGQRIIDETNQHLHHNTHKALIEEQIKELKKHGLTPEEIYMDKGPTTGIFLSDFYKQAGEMIMIQGRFYG